MRKKKPKRFTVDWEPTLITEKVKAKGTWFYQGETPYKATLVKQKYDYKSKDLVILEKMLGIPNIDYIDYQISDEGVLYFWKFETNGNSSKSPTFSTYFLAREHLDSYNGTHNITWY